MSEHDPLPTTRRTFLSALTGAVALGRETLALQSPGPGGIPTRPLGRSGVPVGQTAQAAGELHPPDLGQRPWPLSAVAPRPTTRLLPLSHGKPRDFIGSRGGGQETTKGRGGLRRNVGRDT